MRSILCPVDFGTCSSAALNAAVASARASGARVVLLHVAPFVASQPEVDAARAKLERMAKDEGKDVVAECVARPAGSVVDGILEAANACRAEAIVMGTHGREGWNRFLLGSVAERVAQLAECAVLAAPLGKRPLALRRILCAIDFSPDSLDALERAAALAAKAQAELIVIHVVEPVIEPVEYGAPLVGIGQLDPRSLSRVRDTLGETTKRVVAGRARTRAGVEIGPPAATICARADLEDADLVVVGSRGLRGMKRLLLGSTAERVLRAARRPVLITKVGAPALGAPGAATRAGEDPASRGPEASPRCDVCGRPVHKANATVVESEGEVVLYCSPACMERLEYVEIDRGPDPADR